MIALGAFLVEPFEARALSRGAERVLSTDDLARDVAALAPILARRGPGRWLVCTDGGYACAVALLALWQEGSVAVLPPNRELGTLRELGAGTRGLLADFEAPDIGLEVVPVLDLSRFSAPEWRALDRDRVVLELCTSGSTGARKVIPKTLRQLEAEIDALEGQLARGRSAPFVVGTVSHQHIYGLVFRVLWPLCAARVFLDVPLVDPGAITDALEAAGKGMLISSPAHLKRLPELVELARLRATCAEVFSSGGPLDVATARIFERALGFAPLEVLGSTETGGIAWRRQSSNAATGTWSPFAGVHVEARDGLLRVHSVTAGVTAVTTGDAIEMRADGSFELAGRADRIVKLFDERISLAEIEARLAASDLVRAAAALTVDRNGTQRVAAALVLTETGATLLRDAGKRALITALQAHLRHHFRATALPRAWRFVAALPEDAQGKVTVRALAALFDEDGLVRGARLVQRAVETDRELEIELEVPADLCFLRGHFEGFPVVPGVVQVQWVLEWAAEWTGTESVLERIEALKFKQVLGIGARFRLRIERGGTPEKIRFKLWNERGEFSSGRMTLASGAT